MLAPRTSGATLFAEMVTKMKVSRSKKFVPKTMLIRKPVLIRVGGSCFQRYLKYKNTGAVSSSAGGRRSIAGKGMF